MVKLFVEKKVWSIALQFLKPAIGCIFLLGNCMINGEIFFFSTSWQEVIRPIKVILG